MVDNAIGVLNSAIALVKDPVGFMTQNKDKPANLNPLMVNYVAVLALVPFVGRLVGDLIFESSHGGVGYAVAGAIVAYVLDLLAVLVIGFVIWKLGPSFNTQTDQARATRLAAYFYTPIFLIGILNIVPVLGYLAILGLLYGLYIVYMGLPILLNTPKDKVVTYIVVLFVFSIIILAIVSLVISGLDKVAMK